MDHQSVIATVDSNDNEEKKKPETAIRCDGNS